jgi:hypothetical protein
MDLMRKRDRGGLVIVFVRLFISLVIILFVEMVDEEEQKLMTAMTHAFVVVPLALRSLWLGALKDDPVFGYDPIVGNLLALSSG